MTVMNGSLANDEALVAWIKKRKIIIGAVVAILMVGVAVGQNLHRLEIVESAQGEILEDHEDFKRAFVSTVRADSVLNEKTDHLLCVVEENPEILRLLKVDCTIPGHSPYRGPLDVNRLEP